jgi:mono/diheme cytochrome c family protein
LDDPIASETGNDAMVRSTLVAILLSTCLPMLAFAQTSDSGPGSRIAAETCGGCHQVEGGPPSNGTGASFAELRRMPSMTELAIKVFLQSSHRHMPNFILTPSEIDAITDYILGLPSR